MYSAKDIAMLTTDKELKEKGLRYDDNYMYALVKENYEAVNKMIENSPKYSSCQKKYENADFDSFEEQRWVEFIIDINAENSTRASRKTCEYLAKTMYQRGRQNSWQFEVKDVDYFVNELSKMNFRYEKSLISKILKYHDLWRYADKDTFVVNDRIIRQVLPYYLKYYKITEFADKRSYPTRDDMSYSNLHSMISAIQEKTNLSKHQIDQIIWYCYKNDVVRCALAIAMYQDKSGKFVVYE